MKVISLINMKGGVGKTTLATNICDCLSRRENKKVLLVDIDPQFNATQCLFSGEDYMKYLKDEGDTILDLFSDAKTTSTSTVGGIKHATGKKAEDVEPYKFKENWYVLPGNLNLHQVEMSPGSGKENRLKKFIKAVQKRYHFDFVIIDTPPTPSVWMVSALIASDYYLIPVKPDPLSYTGVSLLENIINSKRDDYDLDIECIGVVFTMVEAGGRSVVYRGASEFMSTSSLADKCYKDYIPKRTDLAKWQTEQTFILDLDDNTIKFSLISIVEELIDRIEDEEK